MIRAIFWDMDGTMVDSEPLWGQATYELSERLGRRLTPELRAATIGGSFPHTLQICTDWAGVSLSDAEVAELRCDMFARVGALFREYLIPKPGVRDLLADLAATGLPMVVTTNTERELADAAIDAVGREFFIDTIAGNEVPRYKPAPDMYQEAARRVAAPTSECLVFEDSAAGMTGASEAGCRVIGLPSEADHLLPLGVISLEQLHGSQSFVGVRATDVFRWYRSVGGR